MRDDGRFDELLRAALSRRGAPASFPVDVADRVMARVARLGPPLASGLGRAQIVRWAIAAALAGVALVGAATWRGPGWDEVRTGVGRSVAHTTTTAVRLAGPASAVAGSFARIGEALVDSARTVAATAAPLQPVARLLMALITVAMLAITTYVIARDMRTGATHKERS